MQLALQAATELELIVRLEKILATFVSQPWPGSSGSAIPTILPSSSPPGFAVTSGTGIATIASPSSAAAAAPSVTLALEPMKRGQRSLVHQLAQYYFVESEAFDPEPHRSIRLTRTPKSSIPMTLMSQAIQLHKTQPAALQTAEQWPPYCSVYFYMPLPPVSGASSKLDVWAGRDLCALLDGFPGGDYRMCEVKNMPVPSDAPHNRRVAAVALFANSDVALAALKYLPPADARLPFVARLGAPPPSLLTATSSVAAVKDDGVAEQVLSSTALAPRVLSRDDFNPDPFPSLAAPVGMHMDSVVKESWDDDEDVVDDRDTAVDSGSGLAVGGSAVRALLAANNTDGWRKRLADKQAAVALAAATGRPAGKLSGSNSKSKEVPVQAVVPNRYSAFIVNDDEDEQEDEEHGTQEKDDDDDDHAAAMAVAPPCGDDVWVCVDCTLHNDLGTIDCAACGAKRA
jgi:hypothetical protein